MADTAGTTTDPQTQAAADEDEEPPHDRRVCDGAAGSARPDIRQSYPGVHACTFFLLYVQLVELQLPHVSHPHEGAEGGLS